MVMILNQGQINALLATQARLGYAAQVHDQFVRLGPWRIEQSEKTWLLYIVSDTSWSQIAQKGDFGEALDEISREDREIAVEVTFPFDAFGWDLEDLLQKTAGRASEGSGIMLVGNKLRDQHWIAASLNDAWELLTRFHDALKPYPGAVAHIRVFGG